MNNNFSNFLNIAKEATTRWWNTYSTVSTLNGKERKTRGEHTQESVRTALIMYKAALDTNCNSQWMYEYPRRVAYQIGGVKGIKCGLQSTKIANRCKTADDHIFGAKLSGEELLNAFREWDFNIDYIVDYWLPQNIWLFSSAKLTKVEHNILKAHKHTKNQKLNFEHYDECGISLLHKPIVFKDSKKDVVLTETAEHNMDVWFNFKT